MVSLAKEWMIIKFFSMHIYKQSQVERTVSTHEYLAENARLSLASYLSTTPNCQFNWKLKKFNHGVASILHTFEPSVPRLQHPGSRSTTQTWCTVEMRSSLFSGSTILIVTRPPWAGVITLNTAPQPWACTVLFTQGVIQHTHPQIDYSEAYSHRSVTDPWQTWLHLDLRYIQNAVKQLYHYPFVSFRENNSNIHVHLHEEKDLKMCKCHKLLCPIQSDFL